MLVKKKTIDQRSPAQMWIESNFDLATPFDKVTIPFKLNKAQKEALNKFEGKTGDRKLANNFVLFTKKRQSGITTLAFAYALYLASQEKHTLFVVHSHDLANHFSRHMLNENDRKYISVISQAQAIAYSKGSSYDCIILDEFFFFPRLHEIHATLSAQISLTGRIIMYTTEFPEENYNND